MTAEINLAESESRLGRRIAWLDLTRCIAITSVVLCHSIESSFYIYRDHLYFWNTLDTAAKLFDLTGIALGRLGVPLFFFITGALVLNKSMESAEDVRRFYRKNYLSLLITMEIWIVLWNLFLVAAGKWGMEVPEITVKSVLLNMLLVSRVETIMPPWYIPAILLIYALLPPIIIAVKKDPFQDGGIPSVPDYPLLFSSTNR